MRPTIITASVASPVATMARWGTRKRGWISLSQSQMRLSRPMAKLTREAAMMLAFAELTVAATAPSRIAPRPQRPIRSAARSATIVEPPSSW